ncbi:hypothetical protein [Phenylobacterium sp.]|uniref:hypothetical protein n=1 Tax=Phenylobacterium sp. TaxID=1871053 RepID=UPI00121FF34D|nr:hypothetical protein [Phenylobacterium sp.]THD57609.1 MAG: hypothetical protein E8A49_22500 [Phenylobacterium sp.]
MRPIDSLKAVAAALLALAANLALTTLAISVYAWVIAPGHPGAFYQAMAPRIAMWSAPPGGFLVLLLAAYVLGRRRPPRKAIAFAIALGLAYVALDAVSGTASAGTGAILNPMYALSMALALAGALAGGALAARRNA